MTHVDKIPAWAVGPMMKQHHADIRARLAAATTGEWDRHKYDVFYGNAPADIAALLADNDRLRAALEAFITMPSVVDDYDKMPVRLRMKIDDLRDEARAALDGSDEDDESMHPNAPWNTGGQGD